VLGVVETLGAAFVSSAYKDALGYGIMILLLLFVPSGLFGRSQRRA
jgi:branched-chain amino acid transport system permease protein